MADDVKNVRYVIETLHDVSMIDVYEGKMTVDEYTDVIQPSLKVFVEVMKIRQNREQLGSAEWILWEKIIQAVTYLVVKERITLPNLFNVCADVFRCLRNASAGVSTNQRAILSSSLFKDVISLIKYLTMLHCDQCCSSEEVTISLRCGIQLFGNLVNQDNKMKNIAWNIFYTDLQLFKKLLTSYDHKVCAYTSMVFYNCLTHEHREKIINDDCSIIISKLIDLAGKEDAEWSLFALEEFLQDEPFWLKCYTKLSAKERLLLLDIVIQMLDGHDNKKCSEVAVIAVNNLFKSKVSNIVKIDLHKFDDMEPVEIQTFLLILCKASVFPEYNKLKTDKKLLTTTIGVLKAVHLLGNTENSPFSPVESFTHFEQSQESIESSPSYGFRRDLIRLIGNLCADSLENQNLAREIDGIALLLDCCRIDMRNPFISEWCILAIRNLLHNNLENQQVVANITVHGDVVESDLLKQLRLKAKNRNGKITLVSLNADDDFSS